MENPVQKYAANTDSFYDFTRLMTAIMAALGEGYALPFAQKVNQCGKVLSLEDNNTSLG